MPYVDDERREALAHVKSALDGTWIKGPGDMEYLIACTINSYVDTHGWGYDTAIAPIRAALDGARREFDRTKAFPYEDQKKEENGDVYDFGN